MINAKLTPDNRFICLESDNSMELKQIKLSLTIKLPNWFIIKRKCPYANIEERFMNDYNMVPVGLWLELINICKKFGYSIHFADDFNCRIKNCSMTSDDFTTYVNNLFSQSNMTPKQYQIDGIYSVLSYKNCCVEVSTSGGKTLMTYIMFKFMTEYLNLKHILYITPKTMLTTQSSDKFKEYDENNKVQSTWTYSEIHSSAKKQETYDETIVFGNYQSLCKKKVNFFDKFDVIIVDECHHAANNSIIKILSKCTKAKYKIGLTGTFPMEGTYENFVIQSFIGPVVYRLTSFDLINKENFATPVIVSTLKLKYLPKEQEKALYNLREQKDKDDPTAGSKLLEYEKRLARENKDRFNYITKMLMNTTKNSLAIFSDVQNNYGHKIYEYIKENSDKSVFYIDGNIPSSQRDEIKQAMEEDLTGNTIIIASMGCFTEGIDIANMWNIFLLESTKSDTIMAQLLGRGMRRFPGKDKTMMIDFVDDFSYGKGFYRENYLYRHGKERQEIYRRRGFPNKVFDIQLSNCCTNNLIPE
jgi:superfamily II DNA or RNA helicase